LFIDFYRDRITKYGINFRITKMESYLMNDKLHLQTGWRLGIDIGGTFTDVIAVSPDGTTRRSAKVPSKPNLPLEAIVEAIAAVGLTWEDVTEIVHGTTIVTNDIVENKFRPCALIATKGYGDSIEVGRLSRRYLYRLDLEPKAQPLVPRGLRFEVNERVIADASVQIALDPAEVERVIAEIKAAGVDTVAVCLMHAFRNPAHEMLLAKRLREEFPYVSVSHEISPEIREFERMSSTVLNAMMIAKIKSHLGKIEENQPADSRVFMMHSASGMATPALIKERPLMLAMSGPAAGVAATCQLARDLGINNALTFDMGGTTTDVCLIVEGRAEVAANRDLGGQKIRLPMVAVDSIGAGGGSIARLVSGALEVGPQSAGSYPGPACYNKGGTLPTVADSDVLLGYLNPNRTLGGSVKIAPEKAEAAIAELATGLAFQTKEAAIGIARVVHATMARCLRKATVERGVDIRDFDMVAFGGAGPMHAAEVARLCGIKKIVVPMFSSGFSALGCVDATMNFSRQFTANMPSNNWQAEKIAAALQREADELAQPLIEAGHNKADLIVTHTAGVCYAGQSSEIAILNAAFDDVLALGRQFTDAHEHLYGYATQEPWVLATVRTEVSAPVRQGGQAAITAPSGMPVPMSSREVTYENGTTALTDVLYRPDIPHHVRIQGPMIIEDEWSTIIVPPQDVFWVDGSGNLFIDVEIAQ
jgi:N-methylhydantoinase A